MKIFFLIIGVGIIFSGCSTRSDMSINMNYLSLGMNKKDVIQSVGHPHSISGQGGSEYLHYRLCNRESADFPDYACKEWGEYYVRLIDGKVESYGRLGDFDSTKVPETKQTIDLNIKQ